LRTAFLRLSKRAPVAAFQAMIRKKAGNDLDGWIDRAKTGLLASFASGVTKDRAAVVATITNVWSNGQTEGLRQSRALTPNRRGGHNNKQEQSTAWSCDPLPIGGQGVEPIHTHWMGTTG